MRDDRKHRDENESKTKFESCARSFFEISEGKRKAQPELSEKNIISRKHRDENESKTKFESCARSFFEISEGKPKAQPELSEKDLERE